MPTTKPAITALDLFCGAGGVSRGLCDAGARGVIGVDIAPQVGAAYRRGVPEGLFVVGDALAPPVDLRATSFIWASPPCQSFSTARFLNPKSRGTSRQPDLIAKVRAMLQLAGIPAVIENVMMAPIRADIVLYGSDFDLDVHRPRKFECINWRPSLHLSREDWRRVTHGELSAVYGNSANPFPDRKNWSVVRNRKIIAKNSTANWQLAVAAPWIASRRELANCIPPPYSRFIFGKFVEWAANCRYDTGRSL